MTASLLAETLGGPNAAAVHLPTFKKVKASRPRLNSSDHPSSRRDRGCQARSCIRLRTSLYREPVEPQPDDGRIQGLIRLTLWCCHSGTVRFGATRRPLDAPCVTRTPSAPRWRTGEVTERGVPTSLSLRSSWCQSEEEGTLTVCSREVLNCCVFSE